MPESYKLSFGKIIQLQDNLAEVIVDPDIEFDMEMVTEYHNWLQGNLNPPFAILINKINSYTYTFKAQMNIANLPEIKAMAVVSYTRATEESTNVLIEMPRQSKWNIRIFDDRDIALNWLQLELDM